MTEGPVYDGEGLGHPLLPKAACVRNDVRLGGELRVLVVSGSNMSGKSTLLRTVGVNAVLALAGAPVRATAAAAVAADGRRDAARAGLAARRGVALLWPRCSACASSWSWRAGRGRCCSCSTSCSPAPTRTTAALGAEAVVRTLVESGAVGLITTHDLALTHITDLLGGRAVNVHFEDNFEDGGGVTFDYRMRPGVVQRSNAPGADALGGAGGVRRYTPIRRAGSRQRPVVFTGR